MRKQLRKALQSVGLNPDMVESKQNPSSSTCRSSGDSSSGSSSNDGGGGDVSIHDDTSGGSSSGGRDSKEKSAEISYDVPESLFLVSEKFVVPSNPEVISYIHYILTHTCIHTYIHTYTFMFKNSAVEYLYRNLPMIVLQSILRACGQRYTDIVSLIPMRTVIYTV